MDQRFKSIGGAGRRPGFRWDVRRIEVEQVSVLSQDQGAAPRYRDRKEAGPGVYGNSERDIDRHILDYQRCRRRWVVDLDYAGIELAIWTGGSDEDAVRGYVGAPGVAQCGRKGSGKE